MKLLKISLFLSLVSIVAYAASTWNFDPAHSAIKFSATHMKISEVEGEFEKYEGSIKANKDDWENAEIDIKIDVNSINTGVEKRDNHLKSDDFFDAENYPYITFKSTSLEKISENKYKLTGDLTIKGTTKQETFDAQYKGTIKDPWGNARSGWEVTGTINRFDYGLKWNQMIEAGGLVVGEDIDILCDVELVME